jgi:hypothetical protein
MNQEPAASAPSAAAARMRRSRERRREGDVIVSLEVGPNEISNLVALGWLTASDPTDKHALSRALVDLIEQAMAMRVTKSTRSEGVCYRQLRATEGTIATEVDLIAQQLSSSFEPPGKHTGTKGLGLQRGATEIAENTAPGAQPSAELIEPYEIDPVELWVPRLDLYTRAGIWAPQWGPRPGQVDCVAPEWLLNEYSIRPSGLA